jgi:hypothetical protein
MPGILERSIYLLNLYFKVNMTRNYYLESVLKSFDLEKELISRSGYSRMSDFKCIYGYRSVNV